ncbi:uncharacterized protein LOC131153960 [Malania oleifera]|uniref:uncharacterized protein LOC131153960 n=1 Tax=Malania oleifera TaxID=397392 RepID=UPI0025AE5805|nr:uncharacterized protein LOC131153960 [Malania oleifera]
MPFGLKNAGATYQRLVNKIFKEQLRKTMEAYVDDMLVKSMEAGQHCKDLRETFELLRRYHMRLNPSKCVFGVSAAIVTDHEKQFDNERFKKLCSDLSIKLLFASVAHPQSNGQVENMNRTILHGLRTRLESMQGRWTEELPSLIWAYHTTKKAATGETPFILVFGAEAVILVEVGIPFWRRKYFNEQTNSEELRRLSPEEEAKQPVRAGVAQVKA